MIETGVLPGQEENTPRPDKKKMIFLSGICLLEKKGSG